MCLPISKNIWEPQQPTVMAYRYIGIFFYMESQLGAHLSNLLLVINHQQRYREQDGSEALNSFLKPPRCGQLVALLQAGDEIREA